VRDVFPTEHCLSGEVVVARFRNALLTSTVVALCACSPTHSAPPPANSTNPNASQPAPQAPIAERPTTRTPTSTPKRCRAAQLAPSSGGRDGAGGHLLNYITLTNTTNESCLLDAYPFVSGIEASGTKVPGTDGSFFPVPKGRVIMRPGHAATLGLETDTYCAASPAGAGNQRISQSTSFSRSPSRDRSPSQSKNPSI